MIAHTLLVLAPLLWVEFADGNSSPAGSEQVLRYGRELLLALRPGAIPTPGFLENIPGHLVRQRERQRPRKRGRRGGIRQRLRRRRDRPPLPSVIFSNARSLRNKLDELRLYTRTCHEYREACLLAFTETWLQEDFPDQLTQEEVVPLMGVVESRGVLRKISDMLEVIMKRMDSLSRLDNSSDARRLEELSSAINRIQPAGLVERIQAIAQNVSNMAVRVEQILQNSMARHSIVRDGSTGQCEVPRDPRYPDCPSKVEWMRSRWTSDPCYAFYGVDGSDCSFLVYLSEVEWFCPPLAWRNHTTPPTLKKNSSRRQAAFRKDLVSLLEQVGTGKESLSFMKRRIRRLAAQWATAAQRLDAKLDHRWREQKKILVHVGFLTEESGDVFSPKVLKGGPLGEMVQWADILTALYVLGHNLKISVSVKELQGVKSL
ncbi:alpha-1,6-mannosylglycoprotein 6-beta-N-acetylglucosaminyltransferase B-like [Engraulis encrasicolus]|uniref:alpha-1,6-mannosylglycoprotein 6-beta-N-acetylglucosaminyltransferase B-like n=1 Tax=Engraulis encrasicolus TaxID=184585 RepID=UPI002FD1B757